MKNRLLRRIIQGWLFLFTLGISISCFSLVFQCHPRGYPNSKLATLSSATAVSSGSAWYFSIKNTNKVGEYLCPGNENYTYSNKLCTDIKLFTIGGGCDGKCNIDTATRLATNACILAVRDYYDQSETQYAPLYSFQVKVTPADGNIVAKESGLCGITVKVLTALHGGPGHWEETFTAVTLPPCVVVKSSD